MRDATVAGAIPDPNAGSLLWRWAWSENLTSGRSMRGRRIFSVGATTSAVLVGQRPRVPTQRLPRSPCARNGCRGERSPPLRIRFRRGSHGFDHSGIPATGQSAKVNAVRIEANVDAAVPVCARAGRANCMLTAAPRLRARRRPSESCSISSQLSLSAPSVLNLVVGDLQRSVTHSSKIKSRGFKRGAIAQRLRPSGSEIPLRSITRRAMTRVMSDLTDPSVLPICVVVSLLCACGHRMARRTS